MCVLQRDKWGWNTKGIIRPYLWLGFYSDVSSDIPLAIVLKRHYGSCKFKTHIEGRADRIFSLRMGRERDRLASSPYTMGK